MVAAHARFIFGALCFRRLQRHAAGMAYAMLARFQIMVDSDPAIEDETLALPAALLARHFFEIAQDSALQVVDLFKAEILHQRTCLLTPDPAGTEHGDLR